MKMLPGRSQKRNGGQALLLVLLSMAVVLTVVLSVASRSITDIQVTTYEEDAYRAFNAAEAGVEKYLLDGSYGSGVSVDSENQVTYSSYPSQNTAGSEFNYPYKLEAGEVATFWFVSHDPDDLNKFDCSSGNCTKSSQIEVCWGDGSGVVKPAVAISIFYDNFSDSENDVVKYNSYSDVKVVSKAYDPDVDRILANSFEEGAEGCPFGSYSYSTNNIVLPSTPLGSCSTQGCLLLAKVKMLYSTVAQPVGIRVIGTLPSQGLLISSEGSAGEVTRKVNVLQSYPIPQNPFENVLFSEGDITK